MAKDLIVNQGDVSSNLIRLEKKACLRKLHYTCKALLRYYILAVHHLLLLLFLYSTISITMDQDFNSYFYSNSYFYYLTFFYLLLFFYLECFSAFWALYKIPFKKSSSPFNLRVHNSQVYLVNKLLNLLPCLLAPTFAASTLQHL